MPLDPALVSETRAWLVKASKDLRAAAFEFGATPPFLEDIAFHSQQAAEKALKAFLTWHGRPFRKTHNLVELGQACVALEPTFENLLRHAAPLTEYAWRFRYPGDPEEPTYHETQSALAIARDVFQAILERLPADVRP
jgi:HEPN domain-containing protein